MVVAWAGSFQECSCKFTELWYQRSTVQGVVLEAASRVRCVLVLLKAKGVSYCSRETGGRAGLYFF